MRCTASFVRVSVDVDAVAPVGPAVGTSRSPADPSVRVSPAPPGTSQVVDAGEVGGPAQPAVGRGVSAQAGDGAVRLDVGVVEHGVDPAGLADHARGDGAEVGVVVLDEASERRVVAGPCPAGDEGRRLTGAARRGASGGCRLRRRDRPETGVRGRGRDRCRWAPPGARPQERRRAAGRPRACLGDRPRSDQLRSAALTTAGHPPFRPDRRDTDRAALRATLLTVSNEAPPTPSCGRGARRAAAPVVALIVTAAVLLGACGSSGSDGERRRTGHDRGAGRRRRPRRPRPRPRRSRRPRRRAPTTTTSTTTTTTTTTAPPRPEDLVEPAGPLQSGSEGRRTKALQEALKAQAYDPGEPDGQFGLKTTMAVWAWQALHGQPKDGVVTPQLEAMILAQPAQPMLRPAMGPTHTEVDLTRQVILVWKDGRLALVSHVSTGSQVPYCENGHCGNAVTPVGTYDYYRRVDGWRNGPARQALQPRLLRRRHRGARCAVGAEPPGVARLRAHPDAHRRVLPDARGQRRSGRDVPVLGRRPAVTRGTDCGVGHVGRLR